MAIHNTLQDGLSTGFADKFLATASRLIKLPDVVDFVQAASATDAGQTAYGAVMEARKLQAGERVGVIGLGTAKAYCGQDRLCDASRRDTLLLREVRRGVESERRQVRGARSGADDADASPGRCRQRHHLHATEPGDNSPVAEPAGLRRNRSHGSHFRKIAAVASVSAHGKLSAGRIHFSGAGDGRGCRRAAAAPPQPGLQPRCQPRQRHVHRDH